MTNRRVSRILALKALYQKEYQALSDQEALSRLDKGETKRRGQTVRPALSLLKGVGAYKNRIDQVIEGVSANWKLNRMPLVDLNIMRIAVYEILYRPEIPRKASINEAVELAKIFSGKDSPSFINGILDKVTDPSTASPAVGGGTVPKVGNRIKNRKPPAG